MQMDVMMAQFDFSAHTEGKHGHNIYDDTHTVGFRCYLSS